MDHSGSASSQTNLPRKKASSFAGFLGKILPSHRPEQGGTVRSLDGKSTESDYRRLEINPEELTEWNIAQDLPIHRRLELEQGGVNSSRRSAERRRPKTSPASGYPATPFQRTDRRLSTAEAQSILRSKERSRQQHRELKDSGDWLGVTGANPRTGEYNVLTPTNSVSSDTTAPSTKLKMSKLTKSARKAERNYEEAKRMEEVAKKRHQTEKAQMKLKKIEQVKAEIQQQQGPVGWKQHRREWSSVKEPGLSPIAQSFTNIEPENHAEEHISETDFAVSHEGGKGKQPARAISLPAPRRQEDNNKLQKRRRNIERSTDTIIHTPSRRISHPATSSSQGQENSGTKTDAQVPNPLRAGKHFLWGRRRRATDPGAAGTNKATVTSSSMIGQNRRFYSLGIPPELDHFNGLVIPDYHLGTVAPSKRQTTQMSLEVDLYSPPRSNSLSSEHEDSTEDEGLSPPPPGQRDRCSSKYQIPRDQSIAVATAISSQSTLKEHTKNHFNPQGLDQSQSTIDQTKDNRNSQHHLAVHPGEGGMLRYETHREVNAREVRAQSSTKSQAHPRSSDKHTRKDPIDPPEDGNLERPHQCRETMRKTEVELEKEHVPKAIRFPDEMPREVEGEGTPEWSNEVIETIECRGGTDQKKDCVYTPIITTTGCAPALLIQPISGAMLGQVDGLATDSADALVTRSSTTIPFRPFGKLTNKAEDNAILSRPSTMQSGSPKHEYSRSAHISGTASARIVEIRRPKSSDGKLSSLARGTLRSKNGESRPVPRATLPPKDQLAKTQLSEKHREATVRGAARTAMLQSQEKVSNPHAALLKVDSKEPTNSGSPKLESPDKSPDKKEKSEEEKKEEKKEDKAKGEDEDTVVRSLPEPPSAVAPKSDAMNVLRTMGLVVISWVWGIGKTWWNTMRPVFDGESELWKRRHQEESTWLDVGVFLFTGVSLIIGLTMSVELHGRYRISGAQPRV